MLTLGSIKAQHEFAAGTKPMKKILVILHDCLFTFKDEHKTKTFSSYIDEILKITEEESAELLSEISDDITDKKAFLEDFVRRLESIKNTTRWQDVRDTLSEYSQKVEALYKAFENRSQLTMLGAITRRLRIR